MIVLSCCSHELPGAALDATVELQSTKGQIVSPASVLTDLYDTEEAIAIGAKLAIDFGVDREGHSTANLCELPIFCVEGIALLP